MKIKKVELVNYKRFANLRIDGIPSNIRLVVLIGPNGSGKSCVFDAFHSKAHLSKGNYGLQGARGDYYVKDTTAPEIPKTTTELSRKITIEMHAQQPSNEEWPTIFHIRSAYRNESDFQVENLTRVAPLKDQPRFERIIDIDQAVSENYRRLSWMRMSDLDENAPGETSFEQYRRESLLKLQHAMRMLFQDPVLELLNFGGVTGSNVFRFKKGTSDNINYMNLSGGEKAAFDILLDIFVAGHEYKDAIYCIDEPEGHISTALHGGLLESILSLVPDQSQLWIATHSIGFVRMAYDIMKETDDVVFLDFSGHDFDQQVEMEPRTLIALSGTTLIMSR